MSTRERRERYMRSMSLTHLLIAVVALIECLLLITFTTYSWIESSSSLIIASGDGGNTPMAIASALDYQVTIDHSSGGTSGVINLGGNNGDHAYYSDNRYFSYAKTSSPDGKTFYFPYTDLAGNEAYRAGDTADYNTDYTYIDFELKNTGTEKSVYFLSNQIFSYASGSATGSVPGYILDAMRISIQKNSEAPMIFANTNSTATTPVSSTSFNPAAVGNASYTPHLISDYTFPASASDPSAEAIFNSSSGTAQDPTKDKISIRVWFESRDPGYLAHKSDVDAVLGSSVIRLSFTLAFESVFTDTVYFDDYAFSVYDHAEGRHVTEEASGLGYRMYFHAYDSKVGDYANYAMSQSGTQLGDGSLRWQCSLPIPYVIDHLKANGTEFSNAYFFYGAAGATGDPTSAVYKWMLSDIGHFSTVTTTSTDASGNEALVTCLSSDTKVIRNLGGVKSGSQQTSYNLGIGGAIEGWAEFVTSSSESLTMINVNDRATGLTGGDYNMTASGYDPYQYVTSGASAGHNVVVWDGSSMPYKLYYYDIPKTLNDTAFSYIIFNNGLSGGGGNESGHKGDGQDISDLNGVCYYCTAGDVGYVTIQEMSDTGSMPITPLPDSSDYVRIYFYNNVGQYRTEWSDGYVRAYVKYGSSEIESFPGQKMTMIATDDIIEKYHHLYLNRVADSTASSTTSAATAKQTIRPYYDTTDNVYKAYVPASWLQSGTYLHYNNSNYYDDAADKIRFALGAAAQTDSAYTYTMLGYTEQQALSALTAGTGYGTWSAVREVRFATELIDTQIFAANAYKLSVSGDGSTYYSYAMAPADTLGLTFKAWLPSSFCSTDGRVRFLRYAAYNTEANSPSGTWYPHAFAAADTTYYAVDPTAAAANASSQIRGYFHVAVINDASAENLVYDIINGDHVAGSKLEYSFNGSSYTKMFSVENGAAVDGTVDGRTYRVTDSTRRWIVPCVANGTAYDTVYIKWTPYPGTEFNYTVSLSDGIYFNIAEGFTV